MEIQFLRLDETVSNFIFVSENFLNKNWKDKLKKSDTEC